MINVKFVFSLMILISSFHGRSFVFAIFLHMHISNIRNPNLVVQTDGFGQWNPENIPSYAQDHCVGGGERKEKKKKGKEKKRKGNKEVAWERKEKNIGRCFLVLRVLCWASWFFTGKKGFFFIGKKRTPF
jgi:hypothetical protein